MRIGFIDDRPQLVRNGLAIDIAEASGGRFTDADELYENWDAFTEWAGRSVDVPGRAFSIAELQAPSPRPRQVFGIGLNYQAHQIESGLPRPDVPLVFTKFPSSLTGPRGELALPTDQVDWEVELAVVIGRRAHRVARDDAWSHVAGITAAQDVSARDVQMRPAGTPQFSLGKSFPGFTPMGPLLITPDELSDPDDISVSCSVNGVERQSSSTADLIFDVPELIVYLSGVLPLLPGDVILTGTPSGVGMGQRPPAFLKPGDTVVTRVADLTMEHRCVASVA
ncbi:fumarylacetoacetate hydrolase family protein [Leifsonia bigeumensis]|uniref:Fumarylacetoacetate hydrolase family protein n=1 Tax=Leifsonella bigeumensis TaxID=433643 RepID=A0ABP7F667_9MICO